MTAESTRPERLRAYLDGLQGRPVIWGADDCCMFAARWIKAETGITLALPSYHGEAEARALMAGGLDSIWRDIAMRAGLVETGAPECGDVGLIEVSAGLVGCIWLSGGRVALRHNAGWVYLRPRQFTAAWRVPAKS